MTEKQALRNYCQQAFDELYIVDSIVNMTKSSCMEQEFNGQYYGASCECSKKLSAERNNYINMLTILSERISNIIHLNGLIENEYLLQDNSNDCC